MAMDEVGAEAVEAPEDQQEVAGDEQFQDQGQELDQQEETQEQDVEASGLETHSPAEDEAPEEEEVEKPQEPSRAQNRIRELSAKARRAEEEVQKYQREFAQYKSQLENQTQQLQMHMQYMQQQYELQLQETRSQLSRYQEEQEQKRLAEMNPLDRVTYEAEKRALEKARNEFMPKLQQLEQQYQAQIQEQQKAQLQAKYDAETNEARSYILSELPEEFRQNEHLSKGIDQITLAYAYAAKVPPAQSRLQVKKILDAYAAGKFRSGNKAKVEKLTKSQAAPKQVSQVSKAQPKKKDYRPSWQKLQENGYQDWIEWAGAGRKYLG